MYKSKLNELCQKKGWRSPTYSCKRDGQDHSPLFKASVVINGLTFSSRSFFKTSKSAGNDAAEVALTHFTSSSSSREVREVGPPEEEARSPPSIGESDHVKKSNNYKESYLLCNKVRMHTSIPITVLPEGNVVMPIGKDKWTVVTLESA